MQRTSSVLAPCSMRGVTCYSPPAHRWRPKRPNRASALHYRPPYRPHMQRTHTVVPSAECLAMPCHPRLAGVHAGAVWRERADRGGRWAGVQSHSTNGLHDSTKGCNAVKQLRSRRSKACATLRPRQPTARTSRVPPQYLHPVPHTTLLRPNAQRRRKRTPWPPFLDRPDEPRARVSRTLHLAMPPVAVCSPQAFLYATTARFQKVHAQQVWPSQARAWDWSGRLPTMPCPRYLPRTCTTSAPRLGSPLGAMAHPHVLGSAPPTRSGQSCAGS